MKAVLFHMIIFSLLIIITACNVESSTPYVQKELILDGQMAEAFGQLINTSTLESDVPNGLGLLIQIDANGAVGTCTAFAISNTKIMTNSHCIPSVLKNRSIKANCSSFISLVINTGQGVKKRRCKKVLKYSGVNSKEEDGGHSADYAVIEIDSAISSADAFVISRDSFSDGEFSIVHSIDTVKIRSGYGSSRRQKLVGRYKKSRCVTHKGSIIAPFMNRYDSVAPLFQDEDASFDECKLIHGNSGSPVTEKGNLKLVKGTVHASQMQDATFLKSSFPKEVNVLGLEEVNQVALMTNLACLDIPGVSSAKPHECSSTDIDKGQVVLQEDLENSFKEQMTSELMNLNDMFHQEFPSIFKYKIHDPDSIWVIIEPKCMVPMSYWRQEEFEQVEEIYQNGSATYSFEGILPTYVLNIEMIFDDFWRIKGNFSVEIPEASYAVTVDDVRAVGNAESIVGKFGNSQDLNLRLCTTEELEENLDLFELLSDDGQPWSI